MVPPAVDLAVVVEVDEVHQQLPAGGAGEAGRVPAGPGTGPGGGHRHLPSVDHLAALVTSRQGYEAEETHRSSDQASVLAGACKMRAKSQISFIAVGSPHWSIG